MANRFWVSFFDDVNATSMHGEFMTLTQLGERIENTTAPAKNLLPLLKLARFGAARTAAGSLRHDANILTVSGCEGDYDGEEMPITEAQQRLDDAGCAYMIYTSPSHTLDRPRWRVLMPFSRELPPGERARMMNRLNGVLGGVLSRESWALSQAFYYGRVI
jgi:hypothetical protein